MIGSEKSRSGIVRIIRRAATVALVIALLAFSSPSSAETDSGIFSGPPVDLDLLGADLQSVIRTFAEVTDLIFAMDARTAETGSLDLEISAAYESIPWDRALDEILTEAGLDWTLEGKILWIHLPAYSPAGDRNFTGEPINLRLEDAKIVDVLANMSAVTGLEIDFDPGIDTTVSVWLHEIPWDQVLDLVLRIGGLEATRDGDRLEVVSVGNSTGMQFGVPYHTGSSSDR